MPFPTHLLGAGIFRHQASYGGRLSRLGYQQFGDSKIQQLRCNGDSATRLCDEDIARLEIPVDHQTAVRVLHCVADLEEQPQALKEREAIFRHEPVDRHAVHVLHDKVGNAIGAGAAIQEAGNVGMFELGEDLPFAPKALDHRRVLAILLQEFDGHTFVKLGVIPNRFVNETHPSRCNASDDAVGPEELSGLHWTGIEGYVLGLEFQRASAPNQSHFPAPRRASREPIRTELDRLRTTPPGMRPAQVGKSLSPDETTPPRGLDPAAERCQEQAYFTSPDYSSSFGLLHRAPSGPSRSGPD